MGNSSENKLIKNSKLFRFFINTNPNMEYVIIDPIKVFGDIVNPICIIIFHSTSDSSAKSKMNHHNLVLIIYLS